MKNQNHPSKRICIEPSLASKYSFFSVFIILFLSFSVLNGLNRNSLHASENKSEQQTPPSHESLPNSHHSVWKLTLPLVNEGFSQGTAFAISPNQFVANFHVLLPLVDPKNSIQNVTLSQEGHTYELQVNRILFLSPLRDLVLFETKESVEDYLKISEHSSFETNEGISAIGYPHNVLRIIKQTGRAFKESGLYYTPTNLSKYRGASGSPILNSKEEVIGVVTSASSNLMAGVIATHLKDLIAEKNGLPCPPTSPSHLCFQESIKELISIANQGVAMAQFDLSQIYLSGPGIQKDPKEGHHWLLQAAQQDYAPAQTHLGNIYMLGSHVQKDILLASYWFQEASNQNHAPAQFLLAFLHFKGKEGVKKDLWKAIDLLQKAAHKGYAPAQVYLASIYAEGFPELGLEKDPKEALKWFLTAARQGYVLAESELVSIYAQGSKSLGIEKNPKEALKWLRSAAYQNNDSNSQFTLAEMHLTGNQVEQNDQTAFALFEMAAKQGHTQSQVYLSGMYQKGLGGVEKNFEEAFYWVYRAAMRKDSLGQFLLGLIYLKGQGKVKPHLQTAIYWFEAAAAQGHPRAKEALETISQEFPLTKEVHPTASSPEKKPTAPASP